MAESTLSMLYADFRISAGLELRYGRDPAAWTSEQAADVARCMAVAFRRAYYPGNVMMPNGNLISSWEWSWMRPVATMYLWPSFAASSSALVDTSGTAVTAGTGTTFYATMVGKTITINGVAYVVASYTSASSITLASSAGVQTGVQWSMTADGDYALPDDFGGLNGIITTDQQAVPKLTIVNEGIIRAARTAAIVTGTIPQMTAITPNKTSGSTPQRFTLNTFPTTTELVTIQVPYTYLPDALTSVLVYPAGGMPYSEVFRTAVLAACESIMNDQAGVREQEFQRALQAAVGFDWKHRPDSFGNTQQNFGWPGYGLYQPYDNVSSVTFTP